MSAADLLAISLYAASAGAAALAALLLAMRRPRTKAYDVASLFFLVLAVNAIGNVGELAAGSAWPAWLLLSKAILLASLAPLIWLYVDDLSSDVPLRFLGRDCLQFIVPALFAALAVIAALRPDLAMAPVARDLQSRASGRFAVAVQAATIAMVIQSTIVIVLLPVRFLQVRRRLRVVFADIEGREMAWLLVLAGQLALNWLITMSYNLGWWSGSELAFSLLGLVFIMTLAPWTVRQSPAFQRDSRHAGRQEVPKPLDAGPDTEAGKYARSLLDDERVDRIAEKIRMTFRRDRVYLDPALSLGRLSELTSVNEYHLSQTFNRRIGASFYDYVNGWRVEEAKVRLRSSDDTVTAVAFDSGFNSRSDFYNAFRAATGLTPAAFRHQATLIAQGPPDRPPAAPTPVGPDRD
jgi:AraC-like DNA-binding protein